MMSTQPSAFGSLNHGDATPSLRRWLQELAVQDWLVFGYLLVLNVAAGLAEPSTGRGIALRNMFGLLAAFTGMLVLVRGRLVRHGLAAPFVYRLVIYGAVQVSYFLFAQYLPVVSPGSLDRTLYDLDLTLFGGEPAVFFDRFVTPVTTEWFAFFYFGYFALLGVHVLPILFFSRRPQVLSEFGLGLLLLFCIGHIGYVLVPGYGPYRAMPELFQHSLVGGPCWQMTMNVVSRSGAQKDIFPSLHTAAPTLLFLFSLHNRHLEPYRRTWPLVGFVALNIVLATMFLRWHYVIDVAAGILLALVAHRLAVRISRWELARRQARGLMPAWPSWFEGETRGAEPAKSDASHPLAAE